VKYQGGYRTRTRERTVQLGSHINGEEKHGRHVPIEADRKRVGRKGGRLSQITGTVEDQSMNFPANSSGEDEGKKSIAGKDLGKALTKSP